MREESAWVIAEAMVQAGPERQIRLRDGVAALLRNLAWCPSCDGRQRTSYDEDLLVERHSVIKAGTEVPCPTCRGRGLDPDHTGWVCLVPEYRACRPGQQPPEEGHEDCGWRVVFPIPLDTPGCSAAGG